MTVSTPEQHEQRASHDASEGKHNVCQGRLAALADAAVSEKLGALPGWQLLDMRLSRAFQCTNFDQSIDFMNRVASIANAGQAFGARDGVDAQAGLSDRHRLRSCGVRRGDVCDRIR